MQVDVRDVGLIPGLGKYPEGGHGNPLQNSYLENPVDRGAWWATVHRVTKSRTLVKQLSTHSPRIYWSRFPLTYGNHWIDARISRQLNQIDSAKTALPSWTDRFFRLSAQPFPWYHPSCLIFFFFLNFFFKDQCWVLLHIGFVKLLPAGSTPCCDTWASHCSVFSCCRA